MRGKYARRKKFPVLPVLLIVLVLVVVIAAAWFLRDSIPFLHSAESTETTEDTALAEATESPTTVPPTTAPPETEPIIESTATITVTGDLLMHKPVFQSCWNAEANDWVFDPVFTYVTEYVQQADYAVANLETTLCGSENGYAYSGYPMFNCPDGIALGAKSAGFDMLLTGNNHCYDTRMVGIRRTLDVVEELDLKTLGTQRTAEDADYTVVEVNGIKIGMTAYTYETSDGNPSIPSINAIQCSVDSIGMINSFDYGQLDKFYEEIGAQFEGMKAQGAEAIVVYMHWGEEYQLSPSDYQVKIAQKLCDMGVDVIVGGHPHVIQPVDLLTSTEDEAHKTLILYSAGNALSNQRANLMRLQTGHTEDGILFSFTFVKYSDGTVALQNADCIPTWVYLDNQQQCYTVLPLDYSKVDSWQETFQIGDSTYTSCLDSYDRTMALVGEGLEKAQSYFDTANAEKMQQLSDPEPLT